MFFGMYVVPIRQQTHPRKVQTATETQKIFIDLMTVSLLAAMVGYCSNATAFGKEPFITRSDRSNPGRAHS
jgi:hypothetical protein